MLCQESRLCFASKELLTSLLICSLVCQAGDLHHPVAALSFLPQWDLVLTVLGKLLKVWFIIVAAYTIHSYFLSLISLHLIVLCWFQRRYSKPCHRARLFRDDCVRRPLFQTKHCSLAVSHLLVWRYWVNDMITLESETLESEFISITFWRRWNSAREAWAAGAAYRGKKLKGEEVLPCCPRHWFSQRWPLVFLFWMTELPWFLRPSWTREDVNNCRSIGW